MAQKYEVYRKSYNEEHTHVTLERITTTKNEQAAINFITNPANVGRYGDMKLVTKVQGQVKTYNEQTGKWE